VSGNINLSIFDFDDEPVKSIEPVCPSTTPIIGQRARVMAIMADGKWHTLPALIKELKRRFGALYMETSTSMRVREMRDRGFDVE
jgi:hypothetical protein